MASPWNDERPMAPHLQIWRWHPAMLSSILHRACAIISFIGLIKVGVALLALSLTGKLPLESLIFSPLGGFGLLVFVFAFTFMALAQLRHALWDMGRMFSPELNNILSWGMIFLAAFTASLTLALVI